MFLYGADMVSATGDLIVDGNIGVGTLVPDQKLVVKNGLIKTFGGYGTQGFVSDLDGGTDDSTATSLTSGLERATFLFSVCEGCNEGIHSFAIQARARNNVLLGKTSRADTLFEIREDGRTSIGKYDPAAWLEISASGATNTDFFRLSSDDAANGDMFIVDNTGNVTWGSSRTLKKNIQNISAEEAILALNDLSPKKYYYKADARDEHLGFIAEDVPELLATADRRSLDPMDIVAVLTKVVQQQQMEIDLLKAQINK